MEEGSHDSGPLLRAAFRAAFAASLPRTLPSDEPEERRAFVLGAAHEATIRLVSDLRRLGMSLELFPADAAQTYVEQILMGERVLPDVGKLGADAVYAGLLSGLVGDQRNEEP